ncbi:MAG: aspartate kinase [Bacteroidales bacterium]
MLVYKFGGASVRSARSLENITRILSGCSDNMIIVISAFGKTTNALEEILSLWYDVKKERFKRLEAIINYHNGIISELFPHGEHRVYDDFFYLTGLLEDKLKSVPSENYDYEYDQFVSFGELISTRIVSSFLESRNLKNRWADAREWLRTDNTFRDANVDFYQTGIFLRKLISETGRGLVITQGFIGGTETGHTTTLGREGSDYTAAIIANIMDAEKLVVWKDVPGILTADPVIFPEAEKLDEISYHEAIELSFYGARVIHPKTIKPLQNKNIPLFVRSFFDPADSGTLIHGTGSVETLKPILIIKKDQMLVSLTPRDFSFVVEDYLSRIFALFFKYRMKVNLIQHSAISFTLCIDNKGPFVSALLQEMRSDFRVLYNEDLQLITIRHYTPGVIEKYTAGKQIIVEQRSRSTAMFAVR